MAITEALTNDKCEQGSADKEGISGAGGGKILDLGVGDEDTPGFILSSAARRQGLKPIRAAPTSTAPRALPRRPSSSWVARGSEGVSLNLHHS